jgi:hypothetical protein
MLKLERLANDSSRLSRLSNRHVVALCNLSTQVGLQGRSESGEGGQRSIVTSRVRVDLTADPDAVVECVNAGLALMEEGYVTVSPVVQEALGEWLDATAFPSGRNQTLGTRPGTARMGGEETLEFGKWRSRQSKPAQFR